MYDKFLIEAWDDNYQKFEMTISMPKDLNANYDPIPAADWLREKVEAISVFISGIKVQPNGTWDKTDLLIFNDGEWGPADEC